MTMLEYTFLHIPGFGSVKEQDLIRKKIYTWNDYDANYNKQLSFNFDNNPDNTHNVFEISRENLLNENIDFFAKALPPQFQYRIAHTFPERTVFLDIETTGLSRYYDRITIIGWSISGKYKVYIDGDENAKKELLKDLKHAGCIITFNGSLFDPEVQKKKKISYKLIVQLFLV